MTDCTKPLLTEIQTILFRYSNLAKLYNNYMYWILNHAENEAALSLVEIEYNNISNKLEQHVVSVLIEENKNLVFQSKSSLATAESDYKSANALMIKEHKQSLMDAIARIDAILIELLPFKNEKNEIFNRLFAETGRTILLKNEECITYLNLLAALLE